MMKYPVHPSQPNSGNVPAYFGPMDTLPGQHNTIWDVWGQVGGRTLGSLGSDTTPSKPIGEGADASMDDIPVYANELEVLPHLDDVVGNGIFDPEGTRPTIHPDAGVFASRYAQPGYLAREQFFKPSEVIDVNTGKPVVYVPGNAVHWDQRTADVLNTLQLYEPGMPTTGGRAAQAESTVIPHQGGWAVGETPVASPPGLTTGQYVAAAAIAGTALGILFATLQTPKRARR